MRKSRKPPEIASLRKKIRAKQKELRARLRLAPPRVRKTLRLKIRRLDVISAELQPLWNTDPSGTCDGPGAGFD